MEQYKYKIGQRVEFDYIWPLDDKIPLNGKYGHGIKTGTISGYVYYILDSNFYQLIGDDGKRYYAYESEIRSI